MKSFFFRKLFSFHFSPEFFNWIKFWRCAKNSLFYSLHSKASSCAVPNTTMSDKIIIIYSIFKQTRKAMEIWNLNLCGEWNEIRTMFFSRLYWFYWCQMTFLEYFSWTTEWCHVSWIEKFCGWAGGRGRIERKKGIRKLQI